MGRTWAAGIIGRGPELELVHELVGDASALPRALILTGEAGIGKTVLWGAGVEQARAEGFRVLVSRPAGSEVRLAFAGLGDLVGGVLDETKDELRPPQARALETALLLAEQEGRPPDVRALGLGLREILSLLARAEPVLVAIDDVQWLDRPSGRVLEFALRRLENERVALLATARAPAGELPFGLHRILPEDRCRRVAVEPVSVAATYELLNDRFALDLRRPALLQIHEVSGGNPFYALEIGRELVRRGGAPRAGEPMPIPGDLRNLLRLRLRRLPDESRTLALAAAALSQPTVDLLAGVVDTPVDGALDEAVAGKVLELEHGRVRFTHPLLASVCYEEAGLESRLAVHARLADVVPDPVERARHLALACVAGPDESVALALEDAAHGAAARGAPDTAAELSEQALRLTAPNDSIALLRRRLAAADYHVRAAQIDEAAALLERAVADLPPGPDRAQALAALGWTTATRDSSGAEEIYEQALDEAGGDVALRAELHQKLARSILVSGRLEQAAPHAEAAVAEAEQLDDPLTLAAALTASALLDFFLGRGEPLESLARALEAYGRREPVHVSLQDHPALVRGAILMRIGDFAGASRDFDLVRTAAEETGDDESLHSALYWQTALEVRRGAWRDALLLAEAAETVARQTGADLSRANLLYVASLAHACLGEIDEARSAGGEGLEVARRGHNTTYETNNLAALGFLELSLEEHERAHELLGRAVELGLETGVTEPSVFPFLVDDLEALVALGRADEAERLLEPFEREARLRDRPASRAAAARCRGLLAEAAGDVEQAREAFAEALAQHDRVDQPFERARTLLALGRCERGDRRKRAAREALEEASRVFDELGARLWRERAEAELRRIGGRRAASAGELSATEEAIVRLVVAGRTNREVAEELALSARTVQWNLSKVYRKLGVRSRTELASAMLHR